MVHLGRLDGKAVAVKRLYRHWDDTVLQDFRSECDLLHLVDHPHVVGFKGAFYDEATNEPILVMELMAENLQQYLKRNRGQLSRQEQLAICVQIVLGLQFLHTRSPPIVHRDLTDKNILLDANSVVKIGDLGQSKLKTAEYFTTTFPGQVYFMPPEAAVAGNSHYNEKLDMFSLGVLMLEIATQQPPRRDLTGIGTVQEFVRRRGDLSKLAEDHPLRTLILSCLNDNPKERPDIVAVHSQLLAMVEGDKVILLNTHCSQHYIAGIQAECHVCVYMQQVSVWLKWSHLIFTGSYT